jgi:hypothetical protein
VEEILPEPSPPLQEQLPASSVDPPPRRSGRLRRFPQIWRDFEATSYTPVATMPPADVQMFDQRATTPEAERLSAILSPPDLSVFSSNLSPPNRFHIRRAYHMAPSSSPILPSVHNTPPPAHPFRNDSILKAISTFVLGPSSKTTAGMNEIVELITSGGADPEELKGFDANTELRRLDDFAARSEIAGGAWRTGSVKIPMPCPRSQNPRQMRLHTRCLVFGIGL